MTGWRVDIKSETEVADEVAYEQVDWAEGEWIVNEETGEQAWQPADGGTAMSVEEWSKAVDGDSEEGGDSDDVSEENQETAQVDAEEILDETTKELDEEADKEDLESN